MNKLTTLNDVKDAFEKANKGYTVVTAVEYGDGVVVLATDKPVTTKEVDFDSQFFMIDRNCNVRNFYPSTNPTDFFNALSERGISFID